MGGATWKTRVIFQEIPILIRIWLFRYQRASRAGGVMLKPCLYGF
jgi:hypothetical protein